MNRDKDGVPLLRVGEQDEVRLAIQVKNQGEDAHEAELSVLLPKALPFMNSEVNSAVLFIAEIEEPFKKFSLKKSSNERSTAFSSLLICSYFPDSWRSTVLCILLIVASNRMRLQGLRG